jgi:HEAT repeat protein
MRKTILAIVLLATATPAAAQERPRRADELQALRALLEAQTRSLHATDAQRALLETQLAHMHDQGVRLERAAELRQALELQSAALAPLTDQVALLEARLAAVGHAHDAARQRALIEAGMLAGGAGQLAPDAEFDAVLDDIAERGVPAAWAPQDPADSLYRTGREQLNAGQYRAAARTFERMRTEQRFARSQYHAASFYWEAFALSRTGSVGDLQRAREVLAALKSRYRPHEQIADADVLAAAIEARLARQGDDRARVELARAAETTARSSAASGALTATIATARADAARESELTARGLGGSLTLTRQQCRGDDIRTVALNALMQMDSEQALPLLREVMERRDECSVHLRRRAMMMLAEQRDPAAQAILIQAALADPDPQVREQATFWLAHVPGDAAIEALARILAENPTPAVRERALFALGQQQGPRAAAILRDYALREDLPEDVRRQIVLSLAHTDNAANAGFLRQLYDRTSDAAIKQQIVMTLSHDASPETADWILRLATDPDEPVEVRRHALLMAANAPGLESDRLIRLYDESQDADMRRHVLMLLGQRVHSDPAAVGKLVDIARTTEDADLQRMLVYMLSESRDPRVTQLMAELVRRPIR